MLMYNVNEDSQDLNDAGVIAKVAKKKSRRSCLEPWRLRLCRTMLSISSTSGRRERRRHVTTKTAPPEELNSR
jgi:hypothetical protein